MNQTKQISTRFREVILNGKWIANTNLRDQIQNLTWQQATQKIGSLNTIAVLTFHLDYYIGGINNVFEGGELEIRDKYSFDMPAIESQEDWENLKDRLWVNAEKFADMVELLPDGILSENFVDEKYGTYYRNLEGMIEHCYYHFGQVVVIKKMILEAQ